MKKVYKLDEIMDVSYLAYLKAIKKLREYHGLSDTSDEAIVRSFKIQGVMVDEKGTVYREL